MKLTLGLVLASGMALLVAGCATGGGTAAPAGGPGGATMASSSSASEANRNFDLRVRCPGVHELKQHGWSDTQIVAQLSVTPEQIPECEAWAQAQPKGYVPPPPPGTIAKAPAPAPAASPAAAGH
ncbi:MAG TPA: hypothetical protein VEJ86_13910 [Candidatus Binataceae bacterium]|nr:hypothetical protein [Candidatus Binataceae bacterium]